MKKLLLTLALVAATAATYAQGTIAFGNSALTRFTVNGAPATLGTAFSFGVFVNGSDQPVPALGVSSTTTAGIIVAPSVYALPGTDPLQVVSLQIKGWDASFASYDAARAAGGLAGSTDVRSVTLGPTAGPGTVIWQTASGTVATRFNPLNIVPEPSTIALGVLGLGSLLLFRRRQAK
jgi:hypothetical protein